MAAKKKSATTAKPEVKLLKAPKAPVVEQPAPEPVVVEPVILQRDKQLHPHNATVSELFAQIEQALTESEGKRQSRHLRWALKSLAMAKETAARHFSLL